MRLTQRSACSTTSRSGGLQTADLWLVRRPGSRRFLIAQRLATFFLKRALLLVFIATVPLPAEAKTDRPDFMLGVDANYSFEMETKGAQWKWNGEKQDLFVGMRKQGARWFRVRLWTGAEKNSEGYAAKIVERANRAGFTPYVVIFLSEDWADLNKQPAPEVWKNLALDQRAETIRAYSRDVVTHLRARGLSSHLYEIGNEIDYGICGVYPERGAAKTPEELKKQVWPDAAKLILACERGVKEADPDAKFLLHIAHWWDAEFCVAFFQAILAQNVRVDYAGLSYFPSSKIGGSLTFDQFGEVVNRLNAAIDRPILVAETAYPSTPDFQGQFGAWRNEVPGYPLTLEGQEKWLRDFLKFCLDNPKIAGAFYWSPEWYGPSRTGGEGMWKAFALFDVDGNAKPAWSAFQSL
jgi:arabinogalactan endo-1,4-beta-galactosidase